MVIHVLYFAVAGSCLFFSLLIILTQLILKVDIAYFYFGVYFLALSVISLFHAMLLAYPDSSMIRDVLILQRVVGLASGFPIILLVRRLKRDLVGIIPLVAIFGVLTALLVVSFLDLFLNLGLLFRADGFRCFAGPVFKIVYVPFSFVGLGGIAVLVFLAYRATEGKARKLLRTLSIGVFCLLPFEYWDLVNGLFQDNLLKESIFLYNVGVFLFSIFIAVFLIQLIKTQISTSDPGGAKPIVEDPADRETLILRQIYDKTVAAIRSKKLYMFEDLTAEKLSRRINESKSDVSRAINLFYRDNYNNFINYFRVEEMKRLLADPDQSEKIVELGIRAGFNSKTSLNRVFYQYVHLTPREFRQQALRGRPGHFTAKIVLPDVKRKRRGKK